ncbi:response regulator [Phenylobacterium sp.]|uniref:response regulator n=1 Tax=Phenylobacterium sp. TaxID=1871053 RepID=UPI00271BE0D0|nr:response regulator [Phenylobacterium sp.]MDO8379707.1 response regulator [Phenylobacterium sp.]
MSSQRLLPSSNLTPDDLSGLKIMVVDDHSNTLRLITDVLRAGGVGEVFTATDGVRARELLRHRCPHMIFTDCKMPVMDGLELVRSIRRAAIFPDPLVPDPEVPVIMVTGQRSERDVQIARLAGVNEFVIKPFTPAAILSRIQLVLRRPRPFIVSEAYVGPDRRRKVELNYSGPLRRTCDPDEVADEVEREVARETISVELEAMRRLISARGGVDRSTLQMIYRVMQHTSFRARQVRDKTVERASQSMITYVDAMGGPDACDPAVIEIHFDAIRNLLSQTEMDPAEADRIGRNLEAVVARKRARRLVAVG